MSARRQAPYLDLIILDELARRGPLSLADLRSAVAASGRLLPEDKVPHDSRANEQKWESDVSNRVQPTRRGSLSAKGHTRNIGFGQYEITEQGEAYRQREHAEIAELIQILTVHNNELTE